MIFEWFFIFNADEFLATGLTSRTVDLILDARGSKQFLITNGVGLGITHDGVFLPLSLNEANPFSMDGYGIYIDANGNVWWGFEVEN